jgi:hypothetical protein
MICFSKSSILIFALLLQHHRTIPGVSSAANIEKTEHRVLGGKRIRGDGSVNRRKARVEACGRKY